MLNFCPVCKSLLSVKKEGGKVIGYCSCGFRRESGVEISSSEINKNKVDEAAVIKTILMRDFCTNAASAAGGMQSSAN